MSLKNNLLHLSATEQAELIRFKKISSFELVSKSIERIKDVNPKINALVSSRFELALDEAKSIDEKFKADYWDEPPTFAGVPITIKECIEMKNMPYSGGLYSRGQIKGTCNATVVERLLNAGCIILGSTNLSELGMWMESKNKLYGLTRNPYDYSRTAGGSSGGEASIVSSFGSSFGIGSDIGGSIRMPAFFSGIFGHKPSSGMVPNSGHYPLPHGDAQKMLCIGPLARNASDLYSILKVIKGPDSRDPICSDVTLKNPNTVDLKKIKILYATNNGRNPVSDEIQNEILKAVEHLKRLGCQTEQLNEKRIKNTFEIWASTLQMSGGPSFSELLGQGKPINSFNELIKFFRKKSDHTFPAIGLTLLEQVPKRVPWFTKKYYDQRRELQNDLSRILGDNTVILYPPYTRVAPRHLEPMIRPFDWVYTGIFNVLEFPATEIPTGLNSSGIPLGVQVAASHGYDHLTLAVAIELEKAFGGWVAP